MSGHVFLVGRAISEKTPTVSAVTGRASWVGGAADLALDALSRTGNN